mmetsp:Transcript_22816/g.47401  ORF Transcript_22816/g.47401 Transcript_22816/m.47401 type:complete len:80 (+) Transcript_22816:1447-1686(+)
MDTYFAAYRVTLERWSRGKSRVVHAGLMIDDMRQELVVETNVRDAASDDELIDEKVSVPRCFSSSLEDVEEVPFCIEKS